MDKEARPSWDNPLQFVLACVSYAVGLGNVWRFPYLCQMHGGGGFLIPYFIMLILEGIPLFYLELAIGQKMRLGSIGAWTAISPYLGGVGLASVVTSVYLCLYYNVINAWSFWYLFHSFQSVLPWAGCPINSNRTGFLEECETATSTQYFFYRQTLDISSSIEENGGIHTGQALCLLLAWGITYMFIVRGVKSTGKVRELQSLKGQIMVRTRLLLLNTFSLAEDSITVDSLSGWIDELNTTYPEQFAELTNKLEDCNLERELDTYRLLNSQLNQHWFKGSKDKSTAYSQSTEILTKSYFSVWMQSLVCVFCLLLGLGFTTTSGNYWFTMFNDYGANFSLLFIVLIEVISVSYIYGIRRFEKDIEDMLGYRPNWYWKIMWAGVSPLLLITLFIVYIVNYIQGGTPTYQAWNKELGKSVETEYPIFAQVFIGLLLVSSVSCVPLTALYVYCRQRKGGGLPRSLSTQGPDEHAASSLQTSTSPPAAGPSNAAGHH
ncbi:hypothetical protein FQN60_017355, partial [Etheostoma spectabile]